MSRWLWDPTCAVSGQTTIGDGTVEFDWDGSSLVIEGHDLGLQRSFTRADVARLPPQLWCGAVATTLLRTGGPSTWSDLTWTQREAATRVTVSAILCSYVVQRDALIDIFYRKAVADHPSQFDDLPSPADATPSRELRLIEWITGPMQPMAGAMVMRFVLEGEQVTLEDDMNHGTSYRDLARSGLSPVRFTDGGREWELGGFAYPLGDQAPSLRLGVPLDWLDTVFVHGEALTRDGNLLLSQVDNPADGALVARWDPRGRSAVLKPERVEVSETPPSARRPLGIALCESSAANARKLLDRLVSPTGWNEAPTEPRRVLNEHAWLCKAVSGVREPTFFPGLNADSVEESPEADLVSEHPPDWLTAAVQKTVDPGQWIDIRGTGRYVAWVAGRYWLIATAMAARALAVTGIEPFVLLGVDSLITWVTCSRGGNPALLDSEEVACRTLLGPECLAQVANELEDAQLGVKSEEPSLILQQLTLSQLRPLAKDLRLAASGPKAALCERIAGALDPDGVRRAVHEHGHSGAVWQFEPRMRTPLGSLELPGHPF